MSQTGGSFAVALSFEGCGHVGVHVIEELSSVGGGDSFSVADDLCDPFFAGLHGLFMLALVPKPFASIQPLQSRQRITGFPGFQLSGIAIPPGVIGRGVVTQSIGDRFDEGGAFTRTGSPPRLS